MDIKNLNWIEDLLKGSASRYPKKAKLVRPDMAPKWPSDIFGDNAWKIDDERVKNGRKLYARDLRRMPSRAGQRSRVRHRVSGQSIWSSSRWETIGESKFLNEVQKSVKGMETDPAQAGRAQRRGRFRCPGFLELDPTQKLNAWWSCNLPAISSTDMPYSVGLMVLVDIVSRKAMDDAKIDPKVQQAWWNARKNCPIPVRSRPRRRSRRPGIARARSTASGPRRLTCTTDRCPRSTGC